eukprot:7759345-Pyramimonas_sp.AAC.1
MGEVHRNFFAKQDAHNKLHKRRAVFRQAGQWGVGVSSVCAAMAHWRGAVGQLAGAGAVPL